MASVAPDSEPTTAPPAGPAPARPSFSAARYAAWLVGPLAFVCIFAKVHKLAVTPGGDLLSSLAALFPDLAFSAAFGLSVYALLRLSRGLVRGMVGTVLHLLVLLLTVLVFVEHGFWLTTGTLLDPYTLGYGLEHLGPLGKVYLSEMGLGVWLGFAALLGVHALPYLALRRARRAPPPPAPTPGAPLPNPFYRLMPLVALLALPACTGLVALSVDVAAPVEPLTENVVVEFSAEALAPTPPPAPAPVGAPIDEGLVLGTGPRALPDGPPPNVIFIVLESTRARSTTPYAPELDTTPFLASLAAKGAQVDTSWTAVTHTSKAIVGILCGIFPKLDLPIEEADPTGLPTPCLAALLGDRGYATAFMQTATARFEKRDQLVKNMRYETFRSKETIPSDGFEETSYFGWEDAALVAPALTWVREQRQANRPFFLTLLTLSTHHTYNTPTRFPKKQRATGDLDAYLNAMAYTDDVLAKLFAGLEAEGALERTLVVITGDHGEAFGEHGRLQHDSVIYEEGLHVPVFLIGPGIEPGSHITGLRQSIDLMPTVLEWLGTPALHGLPGKSLLSTDGHDSIIASCWLRQRCIATRDLRHKYIWHYDKQAPELFDLHDDPLEKSNLLAENPLPPSLAALAGPMKDRLLAFKADEDRRWATFFEQAAKGFVSTVAPTPSVPLDIAIAATTREVEAPTVGPPTMGPADPTHAAIPPMLKLIGMDAPDRVVVSGDPIRVTLHWQVLTAPGPTWKPFTHLIGRTPGARPRYNADHVPVGGRVPVATWKAGTYVSDPFRIQPDKHLPPGTYELVVGFWDETAAGAGKDVRAIVTSSNPDITIDAEHRAHILTVEVLPEPESPALKHHPEN
jgi:arylsulfatase A-like enzyme